MNRHPFATAWFISLLAGTLVLSGCGGSNSSSHDGEGAESTPILHQPTKVWTAPNPGNVSQGGPDVGYEALAASGDAMIGITFASDEGSLLARLSPANGKPLWTAELPSYAEQNALAIRDGRILLVAPGERLTPDGIEGEGPALAYAYSLDGAKLWQHSLGLSIDGTHQSGWVAPSLPESDDTPDVVTDFDAIKGFIVLYDGTELRGINDTTGKEWTYAPNPAPERIVGSNPGGPEELHLVNGADEVLIDGVTGVEKGRDRSTPEGRDIGLVGPEFETKAAEYESSPTLDGIGSVTPLTAYAGDVVYGATDHGLVAIDTRTGKELWQVPEDSYYNIEPAAAGNGFVLATGDETVLFREQK
jgi:outer membrane protein assembly factor BamB